MDEQKEIIKFFFFLKKGLSQLLSIFVLYNSDKDLLVINNLTLNYLSKCLLNNEIFIIRLL